MTRPPARAAVLLAVIALFAPAAAAAQLPSAEQRAFDAVDDAVAAFNGAGDRAGMLQAARQLLDAAENARNAFAGPDSRRDAADARLDAAVEQSNALAVNCDRWRTRALAASPTAAERTARCSTGVRRAPKNSSAMARSCSSHCSASSADLGAGARASNSSARRRAVRRWTGMLRRSTSRLGVSMALLSISTHHHGQSEP